MSDEIARDPLGRSIHMPPLEKVDANWSAMEKLLHFIAGPMGWGEEELAMVFVSDLSHLGDFGLDAEDVDRISMDVGFTVQDGDLLVDIAARITAADAEKPAEGA